MILDHSALVYVDLVDVIDVGHDLTLTRHQSPMVKQGGREKARGSDALLMSQGVESFAYSSHYYRAQRWILLVTSVVKAKKTIFSVTMNLTSSSRIPVNRYLAVPSLSLSSQLGKSGRAARAHYLLRNFARVLDWWGVRQDRHDPTTPDPFWTCSDSRDGCHFLAYLSQV